MHEISAVKDTCIVQTLKLRRDDVCRISCQLRTIFRRLSVCLSCKDSTANFCHGMVSINGWPGHYKEIELAVLTVFRTSDSPAKGSTDLLALLRGEAKRRSFLFGSGSSFDSRL